MDIVIQHGENLMGELIILSFQVLMLFHVCGITIGGSWSFVCKLLFPEQQFRSALTFFVLVALSIQLICLHFIKTSPNSAEKSKNYDSICNV